MIGSEPVFPIGDNGGRRSGIERRQFSYAVHLPERRFGQDRRSGKDRRSAEDRRKFIDSTISVDRRSGKERRALFED